MPFLFAHQGRANRMPNFGQRVHAFQCWAGKVSVVGVEADEAVFNSSIIARRSEIAVRINAIEMTSHRKKNIAQSA